VRFDIRNELLFRVTTRAHAVEKVSPNILPGEMVALIGEAGRGKSTIGQTFYQPHDPVSGAMRS